MIVAQRTDGNIYIYRIVLMAHCFVFWKTDFIHFQTIIFLTHSRILCGFLRQSFYSLLACIAIRKWNNVEYWKYIQCKTICEAREKIVAFFLSIASDWFIYWFKYLYIRCWSCHVIFFSIHLQPHRCTSSFWLRFFGLMRWHSTFTGHFGKISS